MISEFGLWRIPPIHTHRSKGADHSKIRLVCEVAGRSSNKTGFVTYTAWFEKKENG